MSIINPRTYLSPDEIALQASDEITRLMTYGVTPDRTRTSPEFYSIISGPNSAAETFQIQPSPQGRTVYPGLLETLRDSLSVRTKLSLDGTDLTIRSQLIFTENNKETLISEDEDSVDLSEIIDNI